MSQEVSEGFLVVDSDKEWTGYDSAEAAKGWAKECLGLYPETRWAKVYHLDFTTNKMTLIKEYRRRMEADGEGIVEYV